MERLVQKALDTTVAFRNKPNVLLICPPPIEDGYQETFVFGEMGENCVEKSRALAPLYKEVANLKGIHFLDAGSIEGVDMYPYDHMHLSLDAHKNLAQYLANAIPDMI